MKILVVTKETQGARKNDFCWSTEGEPVTFGSECDRESADGHCGCKRAMIGTTTSKSTTTVKVIESDLTAEAHDRVIYDHLKRSGWFDMEKDDAKNVAWAARDAGEIRRIAAFFKDGDVLEKRGGKFGLRTRGGVVPPFTPKKLADGIQKALAAKPAPAPAVPS